MSRPLLEESVREVLAGVVQPEDLEPADAQRRALAFKSLIAHLNVHRARLKAQAAKVVPESQRLLQPPESNGLMTVVQVGTLLDRSNAAIYALARRADWAPFTKKVAGRLMFERAGFERWLARQSR